MSGERSTDLALRFALGVVRATSWLVPSHHRVDWLREWAAELRAQWFEWGREGARTGRHGLRLAVRSLGAISDAGHLRWHTDLGFDHVLADLRHAWRGLRRRPAYGLLMVLVLALGIGATSAVWRVARGVLLDPLSYPHADQLVVIWDRNQSLGIERSGPTPANMMDWRARASTLSGLAAYYSGNPRTLETVAGIEKVAASTVTEDFFSVFGLPAALGRTFTPEEVEAQAYVVVLSHEVWRSRFQADPAVVGRTVAVDGVPHEVVGVMPAGFAVPDRTVGLWLPWDFERGFARLNHVPRDYRYLRVVGRVTLGVEVEQARQDLERIAQELEREHVVNRGWSLDVVPYRQELVGTLKAPLITLVAAVLFVLVVATVNAAHLVLGRLTGRGSEIAIRRALGASRFQLARLVSLEALLLALAGGAAGVALAYGLVGALVRLAPADLAPLEGIGLDAASLLHALITATVVAVALGALASTAIGAAHWGPGRRVSTARWLKGRGHRWPGRLVVTQVAAGFVLLALALLTLQSLRHLSAVDAGFDRDGVLVARVFPEATKYDSVEKRLVYFDDLLGRLGALPGVDAVGASSGLPMNAYNNAPSTRYAAASTSMEDGGPEAEVFMVTTGYFEAMGMRVVQGRGFDQRDVHVGEQVVVINEQLARSVWPRGAAVGERLRLRFGRDRDTDFTVVGVVAGARSASLKIAPSPEAFRPHTQAPYVTMNVVMRTSSPNPSDLEPAVRATALDIDPTQPVHSVTTMEGLVGASVAVDRLAMWLLTGLAGLALILGGIGVYGVMAQAVRRRRRELGIRMALGARPETLMAEVLGQGARLLLAGTALGLAVSFLVSRLLGHLLFEVRPTDGPTLLATAAFLAALVFGASWLPARRACALDPSAALRTED